MGALPTGYSAASIQSAVDSSLPMGFTTDNKLPGQNQQTSMVGSARLVPQMANKRIRKRNSELLKKKYGEDGEAVYDATNNKNTREMLKESSRREDEFLSYTDGYGENATQS